MFLEPNGFGSVMATPAPVWAERINQFGCYSIGLLRVYAHWVHVVKVKTRPRCPSVSNHSLQAHGGTWGRSNSITKTVQTTRKRMEAIVGVADKVRSYVQYQDREACGFRQEVRLHLPGTIFLWSLNVSCCR